MIRKLSAVALSAATALFATSALAQDPPPPPPAQPQTVGTPGSPGTAAMTSADTSSDGSGLSAALLLGYGFDDAFKLGFGARVGYTLPMHLYLGGTFVYHLGTSVPTNVDPNTGAISNSNVGAMFVNAEVGYEIPAGPVMVRPWAGLGYLGIHGLPSETINGVTVGGSTGKFDFQLGGTVLYPVTPNIGIGVDARFIIVSDYNTFNLYLTGQYHF